MLPHVNTSEGKTTRASIAHPDTAKEAWETMPTSAHIIEHIIER
jgi:hypothetical protein